VLDQVLAPVVDQLSCLLQGPSIWRSSNFLEEWPWRWVAFCEQQGI